MKLGILASHPIQYHSPWFRALAQKIDLHVFYAHRQSAQEQAQAGFGVAFDWDVDLLSGYESTFLENRAASPNVSRFFGCDTPAIEEHIVKGDFDAFIVCGWYLKSYWQAVRTCRKHRVPVLVRGDSQLFTPRSRFKQWTKRVAYRRLLRQFDAFLFVGQRNAEYLQYYGVPRARMFFSPHFVDNEWFASRAEQARFHRSAQRAAWGADEQTLVVLFVGKFIEKKRPVDLLRALSLMNPQKATAVFVGSGELEAELRCEAARLHVFARFEGFKNQSELPLYYAHADVLVLPSDGGETWGLVVNEAVACGLPAIVSNAVGCAPDLIEEGVTGFIFRVGEPQDLAERLLMFFRLKQSGHDFSPALREKARRYSVEAAVQGTEIALDAICLRLGSHKDECAVSPT